MWIYGNAVFIAIPRASVYYQEFKRFGPDAGLIILF